MSKKQWEKQLSERPGDDAALVRAARSGRLAAFDALVERYQRQATALAYRLLSNRDDAMEVTQEAFLKAFEKLDTLSRPKRFASWLFRIVSNLSLNRRRARALRKTASLDVPPHVDEGRAETNRPDTQAATPAEIVSAEELKDLIRREIDQLSEMQRLALVLFSIAKMPQGEVAEVLGCSVEVVKWHVFTARKKLKDRLKDYF
ncbi:MAG: sigma-70 family RNA polymerase sigma factor [Phycisphaerae bacterium]|nr:sigma-70 family RNA polymerase sigma factor [Phycisphaerae bacterium]